ncbi:hypothetical protein [Neobacillus bataviensis]|uniref:hypothetical protein n=1 Tax=Neobacillus bataviensis TaxID=220685 RepID=UPI001CBD16A0|nr:hypothetical protein [Neobacillus bataviensis]
MKDELRVNIVKLNNYKSVRKMEELREYPDCYEYCIVPNYEDKFAGSHTECIQMDECFANLIKNGDHYVLIAIIFSHEWKVQDILEWLENYEITLHPTYCHSI